MLNRSRRYPALAVASLAVAAALLAPPAAVQAKVVSPGTLVQLQGTKGCLVGGPKAAKGCARARALEGPGPFMGSRAIGVSPDGKNVYVASSSSDAITVFHRNQKTGVLNQLSGAAGCVAVGGADGCGTAIGLAGPNSVAISADGRNVYATARDSGSVAVFRRSRKTGALRQLPGPEGCITGLPQPTPVCAGGRALVGPDVVVISPDGNNVYVGSFFGNAVAGFARNPATGGLTQLSGTAGCVAEGGASGCAPGISLGAPEGMAVSANGASVYVATALSNAVLTLNRDPSTGALTQATNGSGCIVDAPLTGCTPGVQLSGANAVAVSPRQGTVYATSLFSNSVTSFSPVAAGGLSQLPGTSACLVYLRAVGCSFGRALVAPEGIAVSPDGKSVYTAAFVSGAIDVLNRNPETGAVFQKPGRPGCLAPKSVPGCSPGRALKGASSIVVSPDGRYVYSTAFGSNAVDVFRRVK
jgi:DNA-binding beta-propeller fold protein YncE